MADHFGPIMIPVFAYFFYLVFDAYKTAHAIELGNPAGSLRHRAGVPVGRASHDASTCGRASGRG
jgi:hypothetical protein